MYRPDASHEGAFTESEEYPPTTALYLAAYHGFYEIATLLLDSGQDIDEQGGSFGAPLLVACSERNLDVARLLLDRGANIEVKSPFHHQGALHLISKDDLVEIMKFLLDHGASVDIEDREKNTPLVLAVKRGQCELIKTLLDHGANIERSGHLGFTPLITAVLSLKYSVVNLLLDRGANIDTIGEVEDLTSALHICAYCGATYGFMPIATLLLDRGANANLSNAAGLTPLIMALQRQRLEMSSLLLDRGADIFARDKKGRTVLQVARRQRRRTEKKTYRSLVKEYDQIILRVGEAEKAWQQAHVALIDQEATPDSDTEELDTEDGEMSDFDSRDELSIVDKLCSISDRGPFFYLAVRKEVARVKQYEKR